ncbi:MAG TPA: hypothetical protein DCO79_05995 [Spirochaeta sp.]|nr:hypothetical protein [Spirochaeta sp.]
MKPLLKQNIEESDKNMLAWLNGTGMIVSHWGTGLPVDIEIIAEEGDDLHKFYTDPETIACREDERLSDNSYPLDILPIAIPDMNTLPVALYLGAEPEFAHSNIWYKHTDISPQNDRPLIFNPEHPWFLNHKEIYEACSVKSAGRYFLGLPAIVSNLDALVELRGAENLMMDLVMNPEWVHTKLEELHRVFLDVYQRMLSYSVDEKGWSTQGFFMFRGPGKVGISHCDTAAMISVDMFSEFVAPYVRMQCDYLDYSLYHVDGPDALASVDPLLEINSLTALEFTPGPQVPEGGDPRWYELYRKIKKAGKSVQAVNIEPNEVKPLLDNVGPEGMYLMIDLQTEKEIEYISRVAEEYRS